MPRGLDSLNFQRPTGSRNGNYMDNFDKEEMNEISAERKAFEEREKERRVREYRRNFEGSFKIGSLNYNSFESCNFNPDTASNPDAPFYNGNQRNYNDQNPGYENNSNRDFYDNRNYNQSYRQGNQDYGQNSRNNSQYNGIFSNEIHDSFEDIVIKSDFINSGNQNNYNNSGQNSQQDQEKQQFRSESFSPDRKRTRFDSQPVQRGKHDLKNTSFECSKDCDTLRIEQESDNKISKFLIKKIKSTKWIKSDLNSDPRYYLDNRSRSNSNNQDPRFQQFNQGNNYNYSDRRNQGSHNQVSQQNFQPNFTNNNQQNWNQQNWNQGTGRRRTNFVGKYFIQLKTKVFTISDFIDGKCSSKDCHEFWLYFAGSKEEKALAEQKPYSQVSSMNNASKVFTLLIKERMEWNVVYKKLRRFNIDADNDIIVPEGQKDNKPGIFVSRIRCQNIIVLTKIVVFMSDMLSFSCPWKWLSCHSIFREACIPLDNNQVDGVWMFALPSAVYLKKAYEHFKHRATLYVRDENGFNTMQRIRREREFLNNQIISIRIEENKKPNYYIGNNLTPISFDVVNSCLVKDNKEFGEMDENQRNALRTYLPNFIDLKYSEKMYAHDPSHSEKRRNAIHPNLKALQTYTLENKKRYSMTREEASKHLINIDMDEFDRNEAGFSEQNTQNMARSEIRELTREEARLTCVEELKKLPVNKDGLDVGTFEKQLSEKIGSGIHSTVANQVEQLVKGLKSELSTVQEGFVSLNTTVNLKCKKINDNLSEFQNNQNAINAGFKDGIDSLDSVCNSIGSQIETDKAFYRRTLKTQEDVFNDQNLKIEKLAQLNQAMLRRMQQSSDPALQSLGNGDVEDPSLKEAINQVQNGNFNGKIKRIEFCADRLPVEIDAGKLPAISEEVSMSSIKSGNDYAWDNAGSSLATNGSLTAAVVTDWSGSGLNNKLSESLNSSVFEDNVQSPKVVEKEKKQKQTGIKAFLTPKPSRKRNCDDISPLKSDSKMISTNSRPNSAWNGRSHPKLNLPVNLCQDLFINQRNRRADGKHERRASAPSTDSPIENPRAKIREIRLASQGDQEVDDLTSQINCFENEEVRALFKDNLCELEAARNLPKIGPSKIKESSEIANVDLENSDWGVFEKPDVGPKVGPEILSNCKYAKSFGAVPVNFNEVQNYLAVDSNFYMPINVARIASNGTHWKKWRYLVFALPETTLKIFDIIEKHELFHRRNLNIVELKILRLRLKQLICCCMHRGVLEEIFKNTRNLNKVTPMISLNLVTALLEVYDRIKPKIRIPPHSGNEFIMLFKEEIFKNLNRGNYLNDIFESIPDKRINSILNQSDPPDFGINPYNNLGENLEMQFERLSHNNDKNKNFWLANQKINIDQVTNTYARSVIYRSNNSTHVSCDPVITLPCSTEAEIPEAELVGKQFDLMDPNMPALKSEKCEIRVGDKIFEFDPKVMPDFTLERYKWKGINIGYTNLNRPSDQIGKLCESYNDLSIIGICELNCDLDIFENYVAIPNGYKIFYHEPVLFENKKYVFSAILVKTAVLKFIEAIASPAPFTTILYKDKGKSFTFSVFYRPNRDSKKLKMLKTDNNTNFFLEKMTETIIKLGSPNLRIIVGDLNACYNRARKNEGDFIRRLRKSLKGEFSNEVEGNTFFRKGQQASAIDVALISGVSLNFKVVNDSCRNLVHNDGHNLITINISDFEKTDKTKYKYFHFPKIDSVTINKIGKIISDDLDLYALNYDFADSDEASLSPLNIPRNNIFIEKVMDMLDDTFSSIAPERLKEGHHFHNKPKIKKDTFLLHKLSDHLHEKLEKDPNEINDRNFRLVRNKLRACQRRDSRYNQTGKFDNFVLDQNSIFNISRSLNPKNKSSLVSKCNFTADQFKSHFCSLQAEGFEREKEARTKGEKFPRHIKVSPNNLFRFSDYPVEWDGNEKHSSIKMCLAASKLKTRGLRTILNKELLCKLPDTFKSHICKAISDTTLRGYYPDRFLTNKLCPIPKKGNLGLIKNYRMLSVPHIFCSLTGKYVAASLSDYIEKNKLIYKNQFGFRKGHSCSQAIATILYYNFVEFNGKYVITTFLDLKNAFGCLSFALLLHILSLFTHPATMIYFKSMFRKRYGVVQTSGTRSDKFELPLVGCPQGEPTSPILFNLTIDLVRKCVENDQNQRLVMFADDLSMLSAGDTFSEAIENAKCAINKMEKTLKTYGLIVSTEKSQILITGKKPQTEIKKLEVDSGTINVVKKATMLGFEFCDDLSIEAHVEKVNQKLILQQNQLRCLLDYENKEQLVKIAGAYHFGIFNYLLDVIQLLNKKQYSKLQVTVNRTLRMIFGIKSDEISQAKLLGRVGWKAMHFLHEKALICHLNRIVKNKNPEVLYELVTKSIFYENGQKFQERDDLGGHVSTFGVRKGYEAEKVLGNRVPIMKIPSRVEKLPGKIINKLFPFNSAKIFNSLPKSVRETFGTDEFDSLVDLHYINKCQHRVDKNPKDCSSCVSRTSDNDYSRISNKCSNDIDFTSALETIRNISYKDFRGFDKNKQEIFDHYDHHCSKLEEYEGNIFMLLNQITTQEHIFRKFRDTDKNFASEHWITDTLRKRCEFNYIKDVAFK